MTGTGDGSAVAGDEVAVRSPYRPLPRGARKALAEYGIVRDLESTDDLGRGDGVVVEQEPPRELLERWELELVETPAEVWRDDTGALVEIYGDRVVIDGREAALEPAAAKAKAREGASFTRVDGE